MSEGIIQDDNVLQFTDVEFSFDEPKKQRKSIIKEKLPMRMCKKVTEVEILLSISFDKFVPKP